MSRIITLRYDDNLTGFPEEPLRAATSGREVLAIREHFFVHGGVPHLTLVMELGGGAETRRPERPAGAPDIMATLPPDRRKMYLDLKRWRNERAQRDGLPPFVVLRNELHAEICRRAPHSMAALKEISGIGEKTVEKYGADIVGMIPEEMHDELRGPVGADRVAGEPGTGGVGASGDGHPQVLGTSRAGGLGLGCVEWAAVGGDEALAPVRARTASTGAVAGTTTPGTAAPRTATGTTPATATTTWACASRAPSRTVRVPSARTCVPAMGNEHGRPAGAGRRVETRRRSRRGFCMAFGIRYSVLGIGVNLLDDTVSRKRSPSCLPSPRSPRLREE